MIDKQNIPDSWEVVKLGEVCVIIMGQSPASSTYNKKGVGLPFFQGKKEFTKLHPVVEKWCSEPNKIAEPNDILLSVRAPVGATNIANQKCCIGRGLAAIRFQKNNLFVYYFLKLIEKKLDEKGTGTTFKAISGEVLRETNIPLPPLPEQHRIVSKIEELFTELDKGIETLKTTQQQLKVYRQAVLKWAFEGRLNYDLSDSYDEHDGKPDNQKNHIHHKNHSSDNGDLPEGWEWKRLGDVAEVKRGKSKHRPRDARELYGGKYPFIQTGDVKAANGGTIKKYFQTYSELGLKQSKLWKKGTLCLTIAANIADTAFLGFDGCFPDSVVGITSNENELSTKFVSFYIQKLKVEIESKASATAQKNINVGFLEKLPIPFPHIMEQRKMVSEIESRLSVCDKMEETIANALRQAEALRLSILKKAFEGKLVEQNADDEPAYLLMKKLSNERMKGAKVK